MDGSRNIICYVLGLDWTHHFIATVDFGSIGGALVYRGFNIWNPPGTLNPLFRFKLLCSGENSRKKKNSFPIQSKTSLKILGGKASVTFEWRVRCVKGKSRVTRLAGTKPACVSQQFHLAVNWILGTGHDGKILLKLEETTEIFKMINPTSSTPNRCGFAKRVHFEYRPRPYPPKPPLEILHPRPYTSTPNSKTSVVMRG